MASMALWALSTFEPFERVGSGLMGGCDHGVRAIHVVDMRLAGFDHMPRSLTSKTSLRQSHETGPLTDLTRLHTANSLEDGSFLVQGEKRTL